ncbi:MAG: aspartate aminotransferase [Myxococcales bacterium]
MTAPTLSAHFRSREPSDIRLAQIQFAERRDGTEALSVAIGNVKLPMHPAMRARLHSLGGEGSPFREGVVPYSATVGLEETNRAFLHVIGASGCDTAGLWSQVTDGGSQAMELAIVGVCGPAGTRERPLLVIDAAYTNYKAFAERVGRATVAVQRTLGADGKFSLPPLEHIEQVIERERPGAMLVIPYDNPTGHFYDRDTMAALGRLCVKHGLWFISDEAYRELHYTGEASSSVWGLTESEVPGIVGRRISIETASKVWNACGLRIGALVTDNRELHVRAVAENTASLCPNMVGQWVYGALAHVPHDELHAWFVHQRAYYGEMLAAFSSRMRALVPGVIVSSPDAAIYTVVDVRDVVAPGFDSHAFVLWCAREGSAEVEGRSMTLLVAPMAGFYSVRGPANPGHTQMRIAYVDTPERMAMVPDLLARLLRRYEEVRAAGRPTR